LSSVLSSRRIKGRASSVLLLGELGFNACMLQSLTICCRIMPAAMVFTVLLCLYAFTNGLQVPRPWDFAAPPPKSDPEGEEPKAPAEDAGTKPKPSTSIPFLPIPISHPAPPKGVVSVPENPSPTSPARDAEPEAHLPSPRQAVVSPFPAVPAV
jgi:hypothetical protein